MIFMGGGDPAEMIVGMAVGRAVGGQMAGIMNNSMQNMEQKPPVPAAPPSSVTQYNVAAGGQATGPFDMNALAQMARNNQLTPQSLVWKHGMSGWAAAGTVQELSGLFNPSELLNPGGLPPAANNSADVTPVQPKSQYQKEYTMYDGKNFYSLDRLVEFGMTTAAAQQMVSSMNHAIKTMHIPGAGNPMQPPQQQNLPAAVYYAIIDGKQAGPFCETELARLINDKKLCKETYVWHTGLDEWKTAENVQEILRLVALAPPPPPKGV